MDNNFVCACFFTHNIFLHEYKLHVAYHDEKQFTEDYRNVRQLSHELYIYMYVLFHAFVGVGMI